MEADYLIGFAMRRRGVIFCHKYMGSGVAMVTRLLTYLDANVQNRSTISPPI